jgi:hypothetical protein
MSAMPPKADKPEPTRMTLSRSRAMLWTDFRIWPRDITAKCKSVIAFEFLSQLSRESEESLPYFSCERVLMLDCGKHARWVVANHLGGLHEVVKTGCSHSIWPWFHPDKYASNQVRDTLHHCYLPIMIFGCRHNNLQSECSA